MSSLAYSESLKSVVCMAGNGSGGFLATDVFAPLGADITGGFPCPLITLHNMLMRWHLFTISLGLSSSA